MEFSLMRILGTIVIEIYKKEITIIESRPIYDNFHRSRRQPGD